MSRLEEKYEFYGFSLIVKDCSSKELSEMFEKKFKDHDKLVELSIRNSKLLRCPELLSNFFPCLELLSLSDCGLKEVTKDDFKGLNQMRVLNLSNNLLTTLHGNLFEYIPKLTHIWLRGNKLSSIGKELLNPLENLKYADFSLNINIHALYSDNAALRSLPYWVSLPSLKEFIENKCKILEPDEFQKIPNKMLESEALKDFTITVNGECIKVHRLVLASQSPVLLRMFEDNPEAKELELADISSKVLHVVLNFVYEKSFPNSDDMMLEVYAAAAKLEIEPLRRYAEHELISKVNPSNAFEVLLISNKYESEHLKTAAFEVIKNLMPEKMIKCDWKTQPEKLRKLLIANRKKNETLEEFEFLMPSDDEEWTQSESCEGKCCCQRHQ